MPTTKRGISYTIDHIGEQGWTESFQPDSYQAAYPVTVDWAYRQTFREDMLGSATIVGTLLRREIPETHVEFTSLYCVALKTMALLGPCVNDSDGVPTYAKVRYLAEFDFFPYKVLTDDDIDSSPLVPSEMGRYIELEEEPGVEAVSRNGLAFEYRDVAPRDGQNGRPLPEPPAIIMTHRIITLTLHYWPQVPFTAIENCCKGVNLNTLHLPNGSVVDSELLLLQGAKYKRMPLTSADQELWRITYSFFLRPNGWNKIYNSRLNTYVRVVATQDHASPPYPLVDYYPLFQVLET